MSYPDVCQTRRGRGGTRKQKHITTLYNGFDRAQKVNPRGINNYNLTHIKTSKFDQVNQSNTAKVLVLNVRSARNKAEELNNFITDNSYDLVFLTETWLYDLGDEAIIKQLTPPNFHLYSSPRLTGRGGGICVLHRNNIKTKIKINSFTTFESINVTITSTRTTTLTCLYRPPPSTNNGLKDSQFLPELNDLLDSNISTRESHIIVGDFNFDFENDGDCYTRNIKSLLNAYNLKQLVKTSTHTSDHILDWVVTDEDGVVEDTVSVSDPLISDHKAITFQVETKRHTPPPKRVPCRNIKALRSQAFKNELVTASSSISSADSFNATIQSLVENYAPLRERRIHDRPPAPWICDNINEQKKKRRAAERRWSKTGLDIDRETFRIQKNKVNYLIAKSKIDYYNNVISDSSSSKALFAVANNLLGQPTDNTLPTNHSLEELPNIFIDYFNEKITTIRNNLDSTPAEPSFEVYEGEALLEFKPVTSTQIRNYILSSGTKSCVLDPIPTSILKDNIDAVVDPITEIINTSICEGEVPKCFKHAIITPLLKKTTLDPNVLGHFRPVSNLSFISKILEKVVLHQLQEHLAKHNLLDDHQSAYRTGHSTETATLKIMNDLLLSIDNGDACILTLLDLSSAFDTIDQDILIKRLDQSYGVRGKVLKWFASYLSGRTQSVKIGTHNSESRPLLFGVPQGSVLGPILYTLYAQPVGSIIRKHHLNYHMYADDIQIYGSAIPSEMSVLSDSVSHCVDDVKQWMTINKLQMNNKKTEMLKLATSRKMHLTTNVTVNIGNEELLSSDYVKNLGVFFDKNLNMDKHVKEMCRISYYHLRRISQIRKFLSEDSAKKLVLAFILSRLDYCNSVLYGLPHDKLQRLQRIQNNAARLVYKLPFKSHVTPLLAKLHWLPVAARIEYKIALISFKRFYGGLPLYLHNLLNPHSPTRVLRSSSTMLLEVPHTNLKTYGDRSFVMAGPTVWNALPVELRNAGCLHSFGKHLKTFLFRKYYPE